MQLDNPVTEIKSKSCVGHISFAWYPLPESLKESLLNIFGDGFSMIVNVDANSFAAARATHAYRFVVVTIFNRIVEKACK